MLSLIISSVAVLGIGAVYGADMFFAVAGQTALKRTGNAALTEVMGRLHETADARMPVFIMLGVLSSIAGAVLHFGMSSGWLSIAALVCLLVWLAVYFTVVQPVNRKLTQAAVEGSALPDAKELQTRWDSVIVLRALLGAGALVCSLLAAGLAQ